MSLPTHAPALLVIDMFSRFQFPDGEAIAAAAVRVAPQIARLKAHFDRRNWPVVFCNDNFADWRQDFRQLVATCLASGGASAQIATLLAPGPDHYVILKPRHSAFLGTPLGMLLETLGTGDLVLCGLTADSCVLATAVDAKARGFTVTLARDGVCALPGRADKALSLMENSGAAQVRSVATLRRW